MQVQPYTLQIPDEALAELRARLAQTRWPDEVDEAEWHYGLSRAYLQELVAYWHSSFDWRKQEATLNRLPHFQVTLDGVGLHFIHARGRGPRPLPLILTHGWPSSFVEMLKLVPLLTDPAAHGGDPRESFDVVIPSLPGFGFSDRPRTAAFTRHIPALWVKLMCDVLGYERFAAHGGDIGAFITNRLGLEYPERLLGIHVTLLAEPYTGPGAPELTEPERAFLEERRRVHEQGQAYAHLQRTAPQTLAYSLNDSPAGLAAWIIEKWRAWSDCDRDVERRFTKDELLTNVTIYWATQTIGSSMRVYRDWGLASAAVPDAQAIYASVPPGADSRALARDERITAPTAVALFVGYRPPRAWAERAYNLQRWTEMRRGGHFAALEEPELLAGDLRAFFRAFR